MKLIKISKKPTSPPLTAPAPGPCQTPAGSTASVLPPEVPAIIPEEEVDSGVLAPAGQTAAAVVDTGSINSGEYYD